MYDNSLGVLRFDQNIEDIMEINATLLRLPGLFGGINAILCLYTSCNAFEKMKTLTIIILTFLASCMNLQDNSNDLIGKWECYHKELEDGTTKSVDAFSGEEFEYSCDGITIELNSDSTGIEDTGIKFKYQKKDSILTLGNRSYIIEQLTKSQLVIRNYDPKGINISNFRTKFRKQEK